MSTPILKSESEAVTLLSNLSPSNVWEVASDGLYLGFSISHPVDTILSIYGSLDEFGADVLACLFERDHQLRSEYVRLLRFLSRFCSNPDPRRWSVILVRAAGSDCLVRKLHRLPVVPETLQKPALKAQDAIEPRTQPQPRPQAVASLKAVGGTTDKATRKPTVVSGP